MAVDFKEIKLSDPVSDYFTDLGYDVYAEMPIPTSARCCDLIALKDEIIIAIELKTSLSMQVIRQAYSINIYVDYAYVAIGTNPKQKSIDACKRYGIGVIKIKNGKISVIHKPEYKKPWRPVRKMLLERLSKYEPGGIAGYPFQKGIGPAIECHRLVAEYKEANPKATWKEIFEKVPNHYASSASMASSLNKFYVKIQNDKERETKSSVQ